MSAYRESDEKLANPDGTIVAQGKRITALEAALLDVSKHLGRWDWLNSIQPETRTIIEELNK